MLLLLLLLLDYLLSLQFFSDLDDIPTILLVIKTNFRIFWEIFILLTNRTVLLIFQYILRFCSSQLSPYQPSSCH